MKLRARALGILIGCSLLLAEWGCSRPEYFVVVMQDSAMEPTFYARDVVTFRVAATADRGQVIAFEYPFPYPGRPRRELIARVIGQAGDRIELAPDSLRLNGQPVAEPYAKNQQLNGSHSLTVPADSYFVLGDDRANQRDSRWWGALPTTKLLGVQQRG